MRAHHHHPQAQPEAPSPPNAAQLAGARTFAEFYPLYLAEHRLPLTRKLHFAGSTLALICLFFSFSPPTHGGCSRPSSAATLLPGRPTFLSKTTVRRRSSARCSV